LPFFSASSLCLSPTLAPRPGPFSSGAAPFAAPIAIEDVAPKLLTFPFPTFSARAVSRSSLKIAHFGAREKNISYSPLYLRRAFLNLMPTLSRYRVFRSSPTCPFSQEVRPLSSYPEPARVPPFQRFSAAAFEGKYQEGMRAIRFFFPLYFSTNSYVRL